MSLVKRITNEVLSESSIENSVGEILRKNSVMYW